MCLQLISVERSARVEIREVIGLSETAEEALLVFIEAIRSWELK